MKMIRIKRAITTILASCCLFFAFSQSALAKPPNKPAPSTSSPVIHSVTVDYTTSTIEVAGTGLDAVTEVLLGGVDVSGTVTASPTSLTLDLGSASVSPVLESGNYSLMIDGNSFSVYFSSAIFVDVGAICPCQATWEYFSADNNGTYSIGFGGLTPASAYDDGSTVQLVFTDTDGFLTYIWILNSSYTDETKQCDMPQDGNLYDPPFPKPVTAEEHAACSEYLRSLIP